MAVFKCKMCGGALEINNESVATCDYCGAKQTLPTAKDENLQGLFNRANVLRMKSEFDKAEQIYEKILQADGTQAEAYWGLILCKYGIEYVEDPKTFSRIPTCHRTSFDSIISDEDYKSALQYADSVQKELYEAEAKEIDRIQKEILALSQKEEPYDVFICYKETDETGKRTQDSVIANDIYYQLTQEGFKVFYAAITLEDKLGSAYEPCIFAALHSAKVMLAIGTKPEHFNAVWVKNEWGRFLKMMKADRSKTLIPCYKDMDAYELPEEFAHLQAQDMSKIGFINDVVRGIKKLVQADEPKMAVIKETVVTESSSSTTTPLLKRAFMFLGDGDWNSANEYCEKVLDIDPENAEAYLGKLMAEMRTKTRVALKELPKPFDESNNYQKVIRFADETLKAELASCLEYINIKNEEFRKEKEKANQRKVKIASIAIPIICLSIALIIWFYNAVMAPMIQYNKALLLIDEGKYVKAYESLTDLDGYKDSSKKAIAIYDKYQTEKLKTSKVGDRVLFGSYEQDANTSNGDEEIEWIVLDSQGTKKLLISAKGLIRKAFNDEMYADTTWAECTLRTWLNYNFFNNAFSSKEAMMVCETTVVAPQGSYTTFGYVSPGKDTVDKVFLLSEQEAKQYFDSNAERKCVPTKYCEESDWGWKNWWLRTPADFQESAADVSGDGVINNGTLSDRNGNYAHNSAMVRPVIWVDTAA